MTYHISDDMQSRSCKAKQPGTCPLKDNTKKMIQEIEVLGGQIDKTIFEKTNHYKTAAEAQKVIEAVLSAKNPLKAQTKAPSPLFIKNRDILRESLVKYGNVKEEEIAEVNNVRELVKEWFNGDRSAYNTFKYISENESMNENTKRKIAEMIKGNFKVTTVEQVNKIGIKTDSKRKKLDLDNLESEITIIDEESDLISLEDIRSGKTTVFNI